MQPVRLEEILRIVFIAAIGVLGGIASVVLCEVVRAEPGSAIAPADVVAFLLVAGAIFAIAFPTAIVVGLALHLVLRRFSVPRGALLPVFVLVSLLAGRIVSSNRWVGSLPLMLGIAGLSWLLYSFGPVRLWHYRFDPERDSDF